MKIEPSAISARTSRVETPAAAAISRAVNTSGTVVLMEDILSCRMRQNACRALDDLKIRSLRVFGHYLHLLLSGLPPGCAPAVTGHRGRGQFPIAECRLKIADFWHWRLPVDIGDR
ncbi:MAG TPA: hypothetical protein VFT39_09435 [Vicinamibacterales bacterium]|nr:hypothetical protein [Vicinamibacterales bacterium]